MWETRTDLSDPLLGLADDVHHPLGRTGKVTDPVGGNVESSLADVFVSLEGHDTRGSVSGAFGLESFAGGFFL